MEASRRMSPGAGFGTTPDQESPTMKIRHVSAIAMLLAVFAAASLMAQDTASLTGTVSDSSGAAVAKAQVTLTNTDRGVNRTGTTNESGDHLFAAVPIGVYDLTVNAGGFKKYEAKGIILRVATKSRLDAVLQVGDG